ncbi:MAG TPA: hypothetical protein HPP84_09305 [Rhodospirillaceae bacterium]|nr:hypothetical protein [Rhodospirillaceae bacterium]
MAMFSPRNTQKAAITGFHRIFIPVLTLASVALAIAGAAIWVLYETAFEEKRNDMIHTAQSQARLMEAIANFDQLYSSNYPGGTEAATISQIKDAHEAYKGLGETGEFTLARVEGDRIVFILLHRHLDLDQPKPVDIDSKLAEPMRHALHGHSGSLVGLDYRGVAVLAA